MRSLSSLADRVTYIPIALNQRSSSQQNSSDNKIIDFEQHRLQRNTDLFNRAVAARDAFKAVKHKIDNPTSYVSDINKKIALKELKKLGKASEKLSTAVLKVSKLVRVTPSMGEVVIKQVKKNEAVHPFNDINTRISEEGDQTKDCQAIVIETTDGLKVLAQIFRYHSEVAANEDGYTHPKNYPSNVEVIRDEEIKGLTGKENHTGYYTISSKWLGSGPWLVNALAKAVFLEHETTISPVAPVFYKTHDREKVLEKTDEDIRKEVFEYLQSGKDSVAKFHLGRGASVGWIHINHDAEEHYITVNYVYDRKTLKDNQKEYAKGFIPTSPELAEDLGDDYANNIFDVSHKPVKRSIGKMMMSFG